MQAKTFFRKNLFTAIVLILVIAGAIAVYNNYKAQPTNNPPMAVVTQTHAASAQQTVTTLASATPTLNPNGLTDPIADFKARVTKKPFGIYITPQTSPIQPERFTGYHTGADVEYQDVTSDVPVYALADGIIVVARTASGYGGVMMIEFSQSGTKHTALYGHIRPSSLPSVGSKVTKGNQIGLLGTGYSSETDGERRHLHFAILSDNRIDLLGYVQNKSELSGWIDPLSLY